MRLSYFKHPVRFCVRNSYSRHFSIIQNALRDVKWEHGHKIFSILWLFNYLHPFKHIEPSFLILRILWHLRNLNLRQLHSSINLTASQIKVCFITWIMLVLKLKIIWKLPNHRINIRSRSCPYTICSNLKQLCTPSSSFCYLDFFCVYCPGTNIRPQLLKTRNFLEISR